ncbi:hypothetical protein B0H13DRAFT_1929178 [Mycena leptocephala]|nr:hypothetical protein B0H13DRAFT_1929178 [Mycena leptocephala]
MILFMRSLLASLFSSLSDMSAPQRVYADTDSWIESRDPDNQGFYFSHPSVGYFDGNPLCPTWVHPRMVPLNVPPPPFVPGVTPIGPPASFSTENSTNTVATAMTQANVTQMSANITLPSPSTSSGVTSTLGSRRDTSSGPPSWTNVNPRHSSAPGSSRSSLRSQTPSSVRRDNGADIESWGRNRDNYRSSSYRPRDNIHRMAREDRERERPDRRGVDTHSRFYAPVPDINLAFLRDGHPQYPAPAGIDPSCWDPSADAIPPNMRYEEFEDDRIEQVQAKMDSRTAILPIHLTDPTLVGPWHLITISTTAQAYNFELWLIAGCPFTWELFRWICCSYSGDPTARRTGGEDLILSFQQKYLEIRRERDTWLASQRNSPSRSLADRLTGPSSSSSAQGSRAFFNVFAPLATMAPAPRTLQPAARARLNDAIQNISRPRSPRFDGPSYIGLSPPSPEPTGPIDASDVPTTAKANIRQSTRASRETVYNHYANRPADAWPRGVRTETGEIPSTQRASPNIYDLISLGTLQALAPNPREDRNLHNQFIECALELLSVPGFFERIVEIGVYPLEFHALNQYPFTPDNLDHFHVAAWFTLHGILPGHEDFHHLRSFAQSARRQAEGSTNTGNPGEFSSGYPRAASDVENLSSSNITAWRELNFGFTREGLDSSIPSRPSTSGDAEMQSPLPETDNEVEPGSGMGEDDKLIY